LILTVEGVFHGIAGSLGGVGDRFHSLLNPIVQRGQIHFLNLTEDLLEKSTEMVDSVSEMFEKMRNNTKFRVETKQKLRYLKQKARHLREDIEDQIEIEKERAAKAEAKEEKKKAEDSIHLLAAARDRLKTAIKGRFRRHFFKRSADDDHRERENDDGEQEEEKYAEEKSIDIPRVEHERMDFGRDEHYDLE